MWTRMQLKTAAKSAVKKNYRAVVVVCFIMAFLAGGYSLSTFVIDNYYGGGTKNEVVNSLERALSGDAIEVILQKIGVKADGNMEGVLGQAVNMALGSSNAITKLLNSTKGFFVTHENYLAAVSLISVLLQGLYNIFVRNAIKVGEKRFFMETRLYPDTSARRLSYSFREKRYFNTVRVMLLRSILEILWSLTIVGGVIKAYSYRMIPYILAENPQISAHDAFALSKAMMKGNKWKAFVMDLSFFWWYLLSLITFGLVGFFWLNPYLTAAETELYMTLREQAVREKFESFEALCDADIAKVNSETLLKTGKEVYPGAPTSFFKPSDKALERVQRAEVTYSIPNLILLFFFFSVVGWVWEVALMLVKDGIFVNRGTMLGPWLPIYGWGGVIALVLLRRFFKNPILTFFMMMTVSGIIEYFTSYFLEMTKHVRWWDYTGYFLNVNGRICLEGLIIFGIGGCACIYIVAPKMNVIFNKIPVKYKVPLCVLLVSLFTGDMAYSHFNPNVGKGITD